MTLSIEDRFKFWFIPGNLYYPRKIRSEISSGEPELAVLGRLFSGGDGTAIDVGTNRGFYSFALSKLFTRVLAYEPNPDLARFARRKLPSNVEVYEVALGATHKSAKFYVPIEKPGAGSHLLGSLLPSGEAQTHTFPVTVRTLDSFDPRAVRLIKVDVEGAELDVLQGATQTIERDRPVLLLELMAGYYDNPLDQIQMICRLFGYEACMMKRPGFLEPLNVLPRNDEVLISRNIIFATREQLEVWAESGMYIHAC